ncbi:hypothetical protein HYH03_018762 [Edaphochlamys debaryana]|uniref:Flavin-containing monooxygenase n=1 Tax=Edaphochlamys debaryana TaxID=47281 RepID=A0A835XE12_9CHLO|nr:hypothetical protein HYH03_018762 [Edaphochlamys debaryana]|eukprot:KAG2482298.1 hypothetical protein HYH03_018762 [Edaphochlamys debaryana]
MPTEAEAPSASAMLVPAPGLLRRCLVVGAGVAGLQVARQMLRLGAQVLVLESSASVGGVWSANYVGYALQVPWRHYQFPEFLWPKHLQPDTEYPTGEQVQQYVLAYAEHFDLYRHVRFNCKLLRMRWSPEARTWEALYCDTLQERFFKVTVDYVCICTGIYSNPYIPDYAGAESFAGTQVHARDFTDLSLARGRRVLLVGSGKTALDLVCGLVAAHLAASVTMLYRQAHWPVPRTVLGMSIRHVLFNRAVACMLPPYYSAGKAGQAAGAISKPLRRLFWKGMESMIASKFRITRKVRPRVPLPTDLFYGGQILDDRLDEQLELESLTTIKGEINRFVRNGVILQDGSFLAADVVLYCTGYTKSYEFLDGDMRSRLGLQKDGLYLYRNCLPHAIPHVAFIGSEVSTYNNILTHGLQALWLAHVLSGDIKLPPSSWMADDIRAQQRWRREIMPPQRNRGAVVQLYMQHYHDQLLGDMGRSPKRKGANPVAECFGAYTAEDYGDLLHRHCPVLSAAAAADASLHARAAAAAAAAASAAGLAARGSAAAPPAGELELPAASSGRAHSTLTGRGTDSGYSSGGFAASGAACGGRTSNTGGSGRWTGGRPSGGSRWGGGWGLGPSSCPEDSEETACSGPNARATPATGASPGGVGTGVGVSASPGGGGGYIVVDSGAGGWTESSGVAAGTISSGGGGAAADGGGRASGGAGAKLAKMLSWAQRFRPAAAAPRPLAPPTSGPLLAPLPAPLPAPASPTGRAVSAAPPAAATGAPVAATATQPQLLPRRPSSPAGPPVPSRFSAEYAAWPGSSRAVGATAPPVHRTRSLELPTGYYQANATAAMAAAAAAAAAAGPEGSAGGGGGGGDLPRPRRRAPSVASYDPHAYDPSYQQQPHAHHHHHHQQQQQYHHSHAHAYPADAPCSTCGAGGARPCSDGGRFASAPRAPAGAPASSHSRHSSHSMHSTQSHSSNPRPHSTHSSQRPHSPHSHHSQHAIPGPYSQGHSHRGPPPPEPYAQPGWAVSPTASSRAAAMSRLNPLSPRLHTPNTGFGGFEVVEEEEPRRRHPRRRHHRRSTSPDYRDPDARVGGVSPEPRRRRRSSSRRGSSRRASQRSGEPIPVPLMRAPPPFPAAPLGPPTPDAAVASVLAAAVAVDAREATAAASRQAATVGILLDDTPDDGEEDGDGGGGSGCVDADVLASLPYRRFTMPAAAAAAEASYTSPWTASASASAIASAMSPGILDSSSTTTSVRTYGGTNSAMAPSSFDASRSSAMPAPAFSALPDSASVSGPVDGGTKAGEGPAVAGPASHASTAAGVPVPQDGWHGESQGASPCAAPQPDPEHQHPQQQLPPQPPFLIPRRFSSAVGRVGSAVIPSTASASLSLWGEGAGVSPVVGLGAGAGTGLHVDLGPGMGPVEL